ncbi:metallophosphoesterase [Sphingomonas sp.]|uniref:metallophosphoesterase n=1 Tax=Sphingomonas sp. TaxID=28214 RepID=UPI003B00C590
MRKRRKFGRVVLVLALIVGVVALVGYRNARADPVVPRLTVRLPGWPAGAAPVTVALLSDIHIGSPATDEDRLTRVVAQVNALRPDLVVIAGDFVAGHDPVKGRDYAARLTRPLAGLHARLGVVAVLGNHDHWTAPVEVRRALERAGITVLANQATARGPLAVIGIDDGFSGHADVGRALAAARGVPGARVVLTHTPDTTKQLPRGEAALLLAGHTHCGQAVLPLVGSLALHRYGEALYDPRYECGAVRDPGRLVLVTGGIGASLPLRYGAPPDLWLLTLGP